MQSVASPYTFSSILRASFKYFLHTQMYSYLSLSLSASLATGNFFGPYTGWTESSKEEMIPEGTTLTKGNSWWIDTPASSVQEP